MIEAVLFETNVATSIAEDCDDFYLEISRYCVFAFIASEPAKLEKRSFRSREKKRCELRRLAIN